VATIWQQPKCCRCRRRFDVKTNDLIPLPDTWECRKDDCESVFMANLPHVAGLGIGPHPESKKPPKYHNEPTTVDGIRFASKKEANRYGELKLMERAGEIEGLKLQPRFVISIDGEDICTFVADFSYMSLQIVPARQIVEDVKGVRTPVFKLKKKLMLAVLGIEVVEV
jgi:hypothetical protein